MGKEPLKGNGSRRYISVSLGKRKKSRRDQNSVIILQLDAASIYLKISTKLGGNKDKKINQ